MSSFASPMEMYVVVAGVFDCLRFVIDEGVNLISNDWAHQNVSSWWKTMRWRTEREGLMLVNIRLGELLVLPMVESSH